MSRDPFSYALCHSWPLCLAMQVSGSAGHFPSLCSFQVPLGDTTALQNHTSASQFLCHLAMSYNATRARKRKRVVVEGGLDSDSGEERDVDIGVIIDGHGHSRTNRTLHISQNSRRRPQSLPPPLLNPLPSASPRTNHPSDKNSKRKQVRKIL
jgi:hypothetical protein